MPIVVVEYDPSWPGLFAQVAASISGALEGIAVAVEHVGSTAVPGLAAKPILDIDVVVRSDEDVPRAIAELSRLGYEHRGDLGVTGREAFYAPPGAPRQHMYVVVDGNQAHVNHIRWRDLLRSDPDLARRYGALKLDLAVRYRDDRDGFTEAKTPFITAAFAAAGLSFVTDRRIWGTTPRLPYDGRKRSSR